MQGVDSLSWKPADTIREDDSVETHSNVFLLEILNFKWSSKNSDAIWQTRLQIDPFCWLRSDNVSRDFEVEFGEFTVFLFLILLFFLIFF